MRAHRVVDHVVPQVLNSLRADLEDYYLATYGTLAEAGAGHAELFSEGRGGLVAVPDPDPRVRDWVAMAGWTDIRQLGYRDEQLPEGDLTGTVEIKRVYVRATHRGQGLSTLAEQAMIREMFKDGVTRAVGETGGPQEFSQRIHDRPPFRRRAPFGEFLDQPDSLFFEVTPETWQAYERQQKGELAWL